MKQAIKQANDFIQANKDKVNPRYRHHYHLMGDVGWINDPNGFSIFQDTYHLFYQYHPYTSKWGPMHWGHATTKDFIKWTQRPVALAPLEPEKGVDGGSAFSGSAVEHNKKHYLMYTENWYYRQEQSVAISEDGIHYERTSSSPVLTLKDLPKGADTVDFRDPKVFRYNDKWYVIISSRASDNSGQLLLYESNDFKQWTYRSTLCASNNEIGLMWECPDMFELDHQDVLLVSPQYMETKQDAYHNIHASLYMIGSMSYDNDTYQFDTYNEIDAGFDFYAPQTILDKQGRRIMIAWMAMWERTIPTDYLGHNWAGAMTLPRVLSIQDGRLIQTPVEELKQYRKQEEIYEQIISKEIDTNLSGDCLELEILITNIDAITFGVKLFQYKEEETVLSYQVKTSTLIFDRSKSGHDIKGNKEKELSTIIRRTHVILEEDRLHLHLFLDVSSVEAFIQHGKHTMTGLVYPTQNNKGISIFAIGGSAQFEIHKWDIEVKE